MNHCILVVEDNQLNRELLCDWLEAQGYEVLNVTSLEESFAAVRERQIDAVLLDVQLGEDDGLALARWMRQEPRLRHIPVIAVTAHAMVSEQERILQAGCNAFVSKPVNFIRLREHLECWLRGVTGSRCDL